jgi:hypothetical protein
MRFGTKNGLRSMGSKLSCQQIRKVGDSLSSSNNAEGITNEGISIRKLLNIIGLFIFGGIALTSITTPIPGDKINGFILFMVGSASIFYLLVNIYTAGRIGRLIFFTILILLGSISLFMAYYLATQSIPH